MSAIKKAAEMLRREAESMKECHTVGVGGEWYGESAKAEYDEMIAVAAAAIAERDALRAKIEAMGRQKPIATLHDDGYFTWVASRPYESDFAGWRMKVYSLPGAQPKPSIPEISDDLIEAIESRAEQSYRRHHGGIRGQQLTPADAISWHIIHATRYVLVEAMEAMEANP